MDEIKYDRDPIRKVRSQEEATTASQRERILQEAIRIVTQDRNRDYGGPEENFQIIADFWTTYLNARTGPSIHNIVFHTHDVAIFLDLVKTARIITSPQKEDHWVDKAGYAACGAECVIAREKKYND